MKKVTQYTIIFLISLIIIYNSKLFYHSILLKIEPTKTPLFVLRSFCLKYDVICKILVRYVTCEETKRRNNFWNVKHRNRLKYQKCRVVFGLSLLVPGKCRRVFRSGKENRHQKCVERYKMTKCFSNDSCRLRYFCIVKIFLRNKLTIQFTASSIFYAFN